MAIIPNNPPSPSPVPAAAAPSLPAAPPAPSDSFQATGTQTTGAQATGTQATGTPGPCTEESSQTGLASSTWGAHVNLIHDIKDSEEYKSFRTCQSPLAPSTGAPPSTLGLAELHISGSSDFSRRGLQDLVNKVPYGSGKLVVVDLREESHGMVADRPVSWKGQRNWSNWGAEQEAIEKDEQAKLSCLHGITEEELCREVGVGYQRLPVTDHVRPEDRDVDQHLGMVLGRPADTWFHYHCKAGHGRTTTFMVMDDMIRNASRVSFDDILERQHLIGGVDLKTDEAEDNEQGPWKRQVADERLAFLKDFYGYCAQRHGDYSVPWSAWAAAQGLPPYGEPEAYVVG